MFDFFFDNHAKILRVHRILSTSYQPYKDRATLTSTEYVGKKAVDEKIVDDYRVSFKSITQKGQDHYIYILGGDGT